MRHIGSFPQQSTANRFASYLITRGIHAQAEDDGGRWSVWVREEDQLPVAREAMAEFTADPEHTRYQDVERAADAIQRERQGRHEAAKQNTVPMRDRWGTAASSARRPLTITVILLCGALAVASDMGDPNYQVSRTLLFCDPHHLQDQQWRGDTAEQKLIDVRQGQLWRILTPAFLHGGGIHLLFNMVMFYQLGSMIEQRRGTLRLGLMILVLAVLSNLAQALVPNAWGGTWRFLGLSGVVYGLLGYAWMVGRYRPALGIHVSQSTIVFAVTFMVLGFTGRTGILLANWAHGVGFLSGYVMGLPLPWSKHKP